ncbi:MAG TPA: hypothetical protein VE779_03185 [Candidatus Angelobacter sp.]|jgi:hypothetical protein|nr:hypothetical protein [Candidatus Angelobacter sp.]
MLGLTLKQPEQPKGRMSEFPAWDGRQHQLSTHAASVVIKIR